MKKHNFALLSVCLMFIILIAATFASAKQEPRPIPTTRGKKPAPKDIRSRRMPDDARQRDRKRLKRYELGIEQRQKQQKSFIVELKAIRDMALKENATKTAKRLTALIKQHEAKAVKATGDARQNRDRLRGQMAERHAPSPSPKASPKATSKEDGEKKGKWWQFWK